MSKSTPSDKSGPLGRRRNDPRHKDGDWFPKRPADDEDQQPTPPPDDTDGYALGGRTR